LGGIESISLLTLISLFCKGVKKEEEEEEEEQVCEMGMKLFSMGILILFPME